MSSIIEVYHDLNFSEKEREKLKLLQIQVDRLQKVQNRANVIMNSVKETMSCINMEKRECWFKASKLKEKLQKRCKHNGPTYTQRINRDMYDDVIRTHCSLCEAQISSRYAD